MKKIKSNIFPKLISMLIIVFFLSACEEENIFINNPDIRTLTFAKLESLVFEDDQSGIEVFVKIIGAHPEPGKLTISIHPSKDFEYGSHFTTLPEGSSGTIVIDVEKDAKLLSFKFFPIDENVLRTNRKIQFSIESYEGSTKITNGILNHTVTIREDDLTPYAGIFAFTSFEEPAASSSGIYTDPNRVNEEHDLINVAGENIVDFTSTGGEIGFDAIAFGSGISKDRFGVTDYTGRSGTYNVKYEEFDDPSIDYEYGVGAYSDGNQGFISADVGDPVTITFDKVTIPDQYTMSNFFMDVFLIHSRWESDDLLKIIVDVEYRDGTTQLLTIIDTKDKDINKSFQYLIRKRNDPWHTLGTNIPIGVLEDAKTMQVVITMEQSLDDEEMYLDNLRFVYY